MRVDGQMVRFRSTRDARDSGIGMVHQELSIVPDLSVAENVLLGVQPTNRLGLVDWRAMTRFASKQLHELGIDIDPRARVGSLPLGIQQMVELARVLFSGARIIILDEPTSALSPPEVERLFVLLRHVRDSGRSIVFISHFLDDILRVSDTVTIFRNGRRVDTAARAHIDKGWIIKRMIGVGHEELEESYTGEIALHSAADTAVAMTAKAITCPGSFHNISLEVRAGEVLGIYGFMGSGNLELARALFGKLRISSGQLMIGGKLARLRNTAEARRAGLAFVPESRRSMLFAEEPVYRNVSISNLDRISWLWVRPSLERTITEHQITQLQIRPPLPDRRLATLSGGNQQKVALAKWLTHLPKVLVLSEPTRGMDVGAKEDVLHIVKSLRAQGIAVVVVSTEPETVLSLADRILVMKRGMITREFCNETVSKDRLLAAA
jgi:ribose transport system ATP-binding protein